MINLLPPDIREGYSYAQRNVRLIRWIIAFASGLAILGIIGGVGWLYMHQQISSYQQAADATQATLDSEHLAQTEAKVKDISSSFKLVVQVLSQEVLFSQLLKQIAVLMPAGVNLTNLNISSTQSAVTITAEAASYSAATQLQANLQDPNNQIFAGADTQNVGCTASPNPQNKDYPCTITITALFGKNTPFLFINQGQGSKQ